MKKSVLRKFLEKRKYGNKYEMKPFEENATAKVEVVKPKKRFKKGDK